MYVHMCMRESKNVREGSCMLVLSPYEIFNFMRTVSTSSAKSVSKVVIELVRFLWNSNLNTMFVIDHHYSLF
jgi:hypothetical protein